MVIHSKKSWQFVFKPAYDILIPDLILRIVILVYGIMNVDYHNTTSQLFIVIANLLLLAFTLYLAKRRKLALRSFMRMRLLSFKNESDEKGDITYTEASILIRTSKISDNSFLLAFFIFIPLLAASSIYSTIICKTCNELSEIVTLIIAMIVIILSAFLLAANKNLFVSRKMISAKHNGSKLKIIEKEELIEFLNRKLSFKKPMKLWEMNDFLIIDVQKKIEIYKNRLESLSFESVFLGALSFASFIQIGSQEIFIKELKRFLSHNQLEYNGLEQMNLFGNVRAIDSNIAFFLIGIGSLVSSVFYITVLIKRFAILKSLENAQLKIERAKAWNEHEERAHEEKYTDQIQIELANANEMAERINSNLNIASMIRKIGLYFFFIIVLISAKMISQELFFGLLIITVYGIVASSLMNGELESIANKLPRKIQFLTKSSFSSVKN